MKYLILFFIPFFSLSAQIPKDKQLHLFCGSVIGSWCYCAGQNKKPFIYGLSGATIAGISKETYDKLNGNKFDCKDLGYSILGGAISVTIIHVIRKSINKKRVQKHPNIF